MAVMVRIKVVSALADTSMDTFCSTFLLLEAPHSILAAREGAKTQGRCRLYSGIHLHWELTARSEIPALDLVML